MPEQKKSRIRRCIDGIQRAMKNDDRIPCSMYSEKILLQAKICFYWKSQLKI